MFSTKRATLIIKVLALLILAAFSFFFMPKWVQNAEYVNYSLEQVEKNNDTVLAFEAATLSASLAISALPDDFGSSYAEALTDMNTFFILILLVLLVEKLLLIFGSKFAFSFAIPIACLLLAVSIGFNKDKLKILAARLCILGLAVSLAVPCSTYLTDSIAEDLNTYVEQTIAETDSGAEKLNQAMVSDNGDRTIFEELSELFKTAINGVSDLMQYFRNMITKCMYAIAIMLLKTIVMPLLTFFFLRWIMNETVHIMLPTQMVTVIQQHSDHGDDNNNDFMYEDEEDLVTLGE